MEPATLGAIAGFLSALVVLGVPLLRFLLRRDRRVGRVLDLLVGKENVNGDGVLSRLRQVERTLAGVEAALSGHS